MENQTLRPRLETAPRPLLGLSLNYTSQPNPISMHSSLHGSAQASTSTAHTRAFLCSHLLAVSREASKNLDACLASPISWYTTPRFPSATARVPGLPRGGTEGQLALCLKEAGFPPLTAGVSCKSSINLSKWCFASWRRTSNIKSESWCVRVLRPAFSVVGTNAPRSVWKRGSQNSTDSPTSSRSPSPSRPRSRPCA